MRIKGLEPPRPEASDPKSDVATNYTISANIRTGVAKTGSGTGFRRHAKHPLSFAKLTGRRTQLCGIVRKNRRIGSCPLQGKGKQAASHTNSNLPGPHPVRCKDSESPGQCQIYLRRIEDYFVRGGFSGEAAGRTGVPTGCGRSACRSGIVSENDTGYSFPGQ